MRVCLYTETALPRVGGQELAVDALARRFLEAGHETFVLSPWPRHTPPVDDRALPYPVMRHWRLVSTRHFLDFYCRSLARAHAKYPFDVLHCHNVYPGGHIAVRWAARADVPVVITSHNVDICPTSRLLKKPGVPERVRVVMQRADALVAVSQYMERRMRDLCPAGCRIERIPNGVDAAHFASPVPRPPEIPLGVRPGGYFLSLGRLIHQKGVDLLLDAFARIACANDLHLVIAGSGKQEQSLRAQASGLGRDERIHFTGSVDGPVKTYLLQNALCSVTASRLTEGFSLAVLESYASGVPVIGTQIPGVEEVVRPGRTGLLVRPDSSAELARAMASVVASPSLARAWGAEARRLAQDYDWSRVARQHLALFESLIAARARPTADRRERTIVRGSACGR